MLRSLFCATAMAALMTSGALAQEGRFAVDLGAGTTGGTIEAKFALSERIVLRGGYNYLAYALEEEEYDGILYDADLDFSTVGAFVDLHPFANGFLVSGGAYSGPKEITGRATPSGSVDIGGTSFTAAEVGTLDFSGDLEDIAPFAGLGWDGAFTRDGRFGFKIIAGAMLTGSPSVSLTSTGGTLSNDPAFQAQLAEEEASIQDDVDDYEIYPVVNFALGWRF